MILNHWLRCLLIYLTCKLLCLKTCDEKEKKIVPCGGGLACGIVTAIRALKSDIKLTKKLKGKIP